MRMARTCRYWLEISGRPGPIQCRPGADDDSYGTRCDCPSNKEGLSFRLGTGAWASDSGSLGRGYEIRVLDSSIMEAEYVGPQRVTILHLRKQILLRVRQLPRDDKFLASCLLHRHESHVPPAGYVVYEP